MGTATPDNGDNTYTIQTLIDTADDDAVEPYWDDIATVTLPARSRRNTALTKAFQEQPDLTPVDKPGKYRILDAESAKVLTVKAKPPTVPDLEIT